MVNRFSCGNPPQTFYPVAGNGFLPNFFSCLFLLPFLWRCRQIFWSCVGPTALKRVVILLGAGGHLEEKPLRLFIFISDILSLSETFYLYLRHFIFIWKEWSYCWGLVAILKEKPLRRILSSDHPDCLWVVKRPDNGWSGSTKRNIIFPRYPRPQEGFFRLVFWQE